MRGTAGRVLTAAVVAAAALLAAAPAGANPVSHDEFRTLVNQAGRDPSALARLRDVTEVDGRPVDVRRALDGAAGADLDARLAALGGAAPTTGTGGEADQARAGARDVLAQRKFNPPGIPRPFRGVLEWLRDRAEPVTRPIARLWDALVEEAVGRVAVVVLVLVLATALARSLVRRRTAVAVSGRRRRTDGPEENADALDRRADEAEAAGDYGAAVRLRFRAGLLRLDQAGHLSFRPSLTTRAAVRRVHSPSLAVLGRAFDEIAYGGRPAAPADAAQAAEYWPRALAEAGPSRSRGATR